MYGKFVTIDTKDGRTFNGVHVEGWQTYQEALNDELQARGAKRGQVDKVWSNGNVIYNAKNPIVKTKDGKTYKQADYF